MLQNGHHAKIDQWRREKSLENTRNKRPDLLERAELTDRDRQYLAGLEAQKEEETE